jgi:peptidoglycan-associated lipoprotein
MDMKNSSLLAAVSLVALAACGDQPAFSSWHQEAGAFLTNDGLGDSTRNNRQVMSGEAGYVLDLALRFASDVPSMVNFEFDSATLDGAAMQSLRIQANWIKQFPEIRFKVFGHTDLVGSDAYNRNLGLRRAKAVVNFLVSQGISRSRLEALASFGETQPLIVTQDRERKNRRTVTEVSGFVKGHPGTLNGKYAAIILREYVLSGTEIPKNTETGFAINTVESGG